jgi:proline racemase
MAEKLIIETIEAHAQCEGGRVITNMAHLVKGETLKERVDYCEANLDWFRHAILHEPRGYPALCAVFILPPVNTGSDFGIIVLEQGGFTAMSGSNTMCAVTAALEKGIV